MARLGRRQPFPPIIKGLIRFQPASDPVADTPYIVSFVAHERAKMRRPRFFPAIIKGVTSIQPPPIARRSYVISQISHDESARRMSVLVKSVAIIASPVPPTPVPRVRPKIRIKHDEARIGSRGRGHEQQVAAIINELGRTGELIGSVSDPALGYLADDPSAVGTTEVLPLKEVIDRIIAYIKAQNGTGI